MITEMTKQDIFNRLVKLAKMPASMREEFLAADLVHQENLERIQGALGALLLDVATETGQVPVLLREFPYAFEEAS